MICMVESTYIILRSKIWSLMVYKRYCNVDSSYNYALYMYNNTFKMVKIQDFGCFLPARAMRFTCTECLTSCPVAKSTNLGHLTPLSPSTGGGSSRNTQYTFPTNHTRHSTYLHYVLRVSNVSSPTNEFLYVSKLVRVASAFDIRRRSDGGGDPPKKN